MLRQVSLIVVSATLLLSSCAQGESADVSGPDSSSTMPDTPASVAVTTTTTTLPRATTTAAPFAADGAETCAELADMFVGLNQRLLDALGTRSDADMEGDIPPEIVAAGEEIVEWFYGSAGGRVTLLCPGGDTEFDELVCDQASSLEARGEAAVRHLRDNFPHCDQ